jgi:23S rRNA pseudouridine2605 synthase
MSPEDNEKDDATLDGSEVEELFGRGMPPLQKWLQAMGVAGKREARAAIRAGRVTVDGEVVTRYAEPVEDDAVVVYEGVAVSEPQRRVVLRMHKPRAHLAVHTDPAGRAALGQYLPADIPRVFAVGRLDFNTEGLLLWTNDGRLARRLLHPDYAIERRYGVKVRGHLEPDDPAFDRIRGGMAVGGVQFRPAKVEVGERRTRATWVYLTLTEGKFREIRKMCHELGWQIVKLRRISFGPIGLDDLNPRCVRLLDPADLAALYLAAGLRTGSTDGSGTVAPVASGTGGPDGARASGD